MLNGICAPRKGAVGVCLFRMFCATGSRRLSGMIFPGNAKPLAPHREFAVDGSKMAPASTVSVEPSHAGDETVVVLPVKYSLKSPALSLAVHDSVNPG